MRTRPRPTATRVILLLAAAVLALLVVTTSVGRAQPVVGNHPSPVDEVARSDPGSDAPPVPPDVLALGDEVKPLAPEGMIPFNQALDVAVFEFPFIEHGTIDGYLVALTDPDQLAGVGAHDRAVWIIRVSGLSADIFSAPILPDGSAAHGGLATRGYIYVDAVTGDWLQAHFE